MHDRMDWIEIQPYNLVEPLALFRFETSVTFFQHCGVPVGTQHIVATEFIPLNGAAQIVATEFIPLNSRKKIPTPLAPLTKTPYLARN